MTQNKNRRPVMIAIGGLPGSGKSTLAHAISHILPEAVFIDSDVTRKKMFGVEPTTPLPDDAYSPENNKRFIEFIRAEAARHFKTHHFVIVTGLFTDDTTRTEQEAFARKNRAEFIGLMVQASLSTLVQRVAHRSKKASSASDANIGVLKRQAMQYYSRNRRNEAWAIVNSEQAFDLQVNDALKAIEHARKTLPAASSKNQPKNN